MKACLAGGVTSRNKHHSTPPPCPAPNPGAPDGSFLKTCGFIRVKNKKEVFLKARGTWKVIEQTCHTQVNLICCRPSSSPSSILCFFFCSLNMRTPASLDESEQTAQNSTDRWVQKHTTKRSNSKFIQKYGLLIIQRNIPYHTDVTV